MKVTEIIGNWELRNGKVIADKNCKLIESMIKDEFTKLESSNDGWNSIYEDRSGAIWELSYPENHLQGGGPPKLVKIQ